MKTGIELIAEERERQISKEGWTSGHDDGHKCGELSQAAACYAVAASMTTANQVKNASLIPLPKQWPWQDWGGDNFWNPSADPLRNLVKAGALISAEIDRLQRINHPANDEDDL